MPVAQPRIVGDEVERFSVSARTIHARVERNVDSSVGSGGQSVRPHRWNRTCSARDQAPNDQYLATVVSDREPEVDDRAERKRSGDLWHTAWNGQLRCRRAVRWNSRQHTDQARINDRGLRRFPATSLTVPCCTTGEPADDRDGEEYVPEVDARALGDSHVSVGTTHRSCPLSRLFDDRKPLLQPSTVQRPKLEILHNAAAVNKVRRWEPRDIVIIVNVSLRVERDRIRDVQRFDV